MTTPSVCTVMNYLQEDVSIKYLARIGSWYVKGIRYFHTPDSEER